MCLLNRPLAPRRLRVLSIPASCERRGRYERNRFAVRLTVLLAPHDDIRLRPKRQYKGAMLVYVIPGVSRRDGKVYDNVFRIKGHPVFDVKDYRLRFGSKARMDANLAGSELRNAQRAPDARRPPTMLLSFDEMRCRSRRKRMHHPWLRRTRVQHQAVQVGEPIHTLCQFRWGDAQRGGNMPRLGKTPDLKELLNQDRVNVRKPLHAVLVDLFHPTAPL